MNDAGFRRPIGQEIDQPSCPQILLNDEGWKLTDTDAAQCCEAKRHHVFRNETWPVPDCGDRALPAIEAPFMLQLGGIPCETGQRATNADIAGILQRAAADLLA